MAKPKLFFAGQPGHPAAGDLNRARDVATDAVAEHRQPLDFPFDRLDIFLTLALALCVGAAYVPIVYGWLNTIGDYDAHMRFARAFGESGVLVSPACLFHILVAELVHLSAAASYESAGEAVLIFSHACTGAVIYLCARWAFRKQSATAGRVLATIVALTGPFIQPPVPAGIGYSIGYLWAEPYHSPTYTLLKPFALASAAFAVYFLTEPRRVNWKAVTLCAITVSAGTLAKPSYAICALPALALLASYRFAKKQPLPKISLLCGWLIPALAVLAWQYTRTYTSWEGPPRYADSILFAPLAVMKAHTDNIAAPYFWSALLPLCVLASFGKRAWGDVGFRFSLIAFLAGTAYAYTLAEKYNLAAGNFLWSAYITLFIVYLFSTIFIMQQIMTNLRAPAKLLQAVPCVAVLMWQLAIGISVHMTYLRLARQARLQAITMYRKTVHQGPYLAPAPETKSPPGRPRE